MSEWGFASHLVLVVAFLAGFLMLARLLRQRRSPQSALAWIGFAVVVPYVAVPFFFLLGWRKIRRPQPARVFKGAASAIPLQPLLASYGVPPVRSDSRIRLCTTGVSGHAALVDLIESARAQLDIQVFALYLDREGRDILKRLERRASEGVAVRLLLDGFGSLTAWPWALRPLSRAGAEVRFFHPLLRPRWWFRANLRNHRKIVIADAERVLAGGVNIAGEYLGPTPDAKRWTDLAFLVEGPVVGDYQRILDADWSYVTGTPVLARSPSIRRVGEARLQVVPSGPDYAEDALEAALLQSIYGAEQRVWLVTPYFVPGSEVMQALTVAARRGVEVRLVVPERSNHRLADWAGGPYLREIERHGAQVLCYQPGMLHAKAVLIDESVAMLGSANLDLRSLYLNYEVMMLLYDGDAISQVEGWMRQLVPSTAPANAEVGPLREVFEGAVRLLAPIL